LEKNSHTRECIKRMAVGPKASKNLSREEVSRAMSDILEGHVEPVMAAVFFIGLRLKRETQEENEGILEGIGVHASTWEAPLPRVLDMADPYDGFKRMPHWSLFRAAVVGAMGLPVVLHGSTQIPPKNGITTLDMIRYGVSSPELRISREATQHSLLECGWTFCDLEGFCPPLERMRTLRDHMVKRTCLATVEKLLLPVRGQESTVCISGYVHPGYGETVAKLLSRSGVNSGWVFCGPEGHPSLHGGKTSSIMGFRDDISAMETLDVPGTGFTWPKDRQVIPRNILEAGLSALQPREESEGLRGHLIHEAGVHAHLADGGRSLEEGIELARTVIENGSALRGLQRGLSILGRSGE